MKRLLTISLAVLYLMVSSGLLLEIHHCMGRIADSGLAWFPGGQEEQCGKCGMDKSGESSHCCKDEVKLVKVSSDQKPSSLSYQFQAPALNLVTSHWLGWDDQAIQPDPLVFYENHAPPLPFASELPFLCVFRI